MQREDLKLKTANTQSQKHTWSHDARSQCVFAVTVSDLIELIPATAFALVTGETKI